MKRLLLLGLAGLVVVSLAPLIAGCTLDETAGRSVSLPAAGIATVRISCEAGILEVEGRSDATDVSVTGTAYARSTRGLEDLQIDARTTGSEIVIQVETPGYTKFDLTVEIPDSLQVIVDDTSGSVVITDVAGVQLTDGSGNVEVSAVSGAVVVEDDGSGDINIRNVGQSVDIVDDGSGDISVSNVAGNFHVRDDGSGDIVARDIGGDFVVDDSGSGSVRYSNIGGTVDIPSD